MGAAELLPDAERRRRRREIWLSSLVLVAIAAIAFGQQWASAPRRALPAGSALFLFLNALNVFLIFLLVYLVARNLVKLVFERRRGALGSRLNLKFVLAFALVAMVPTVILFLVSSSIIGASIDTWFSLQIDRTLDESRQIADAYYQSASDDAQLFGRRIADQVTERRLLREEEREALAEFVQEKQRDYHLGVVEVFSATGEALVVAVNPDIPAANFSRPDSELVSSALQGGATSRVEEVVGGSVIRSAVPIRSSFREHEAVGAVVVNHFVPFALTRKIEGIRAAHDEYRRLQPYAGHIERIYQLELLLFSLVVVLFAIWWGFRIAKGVSTPIRALAEGTAEVARGNLDVQVEPHSNDEVGFLVRSFNRMTRDLRDARDGVESTTAELERRRRYMEVVLRNIGAGVISLDADDRINTINPAAQRLLAVPPGVGVVGRPWAEVLPREQAGLVAELRDSLQPGLRESIRRQVQLAVGDERLTLLVTMTLLKDEEGVVLGSVVVFDDYSQLVKVQRMEAWQEVARRIAHEIKNPLTPIQLSAQRIRRRFGARLRGDPAEAQVFDECVDAITSQVDSLKLLVNEFSNFARLPSANPVPDDLNRIVQEAVSRYAGTEGVVLKTDLDPQLPRADIDREQFGRLLTNLIDNAIAAVRARAAYEPDYDVGHVSLRTVHDAPLSAVRLEVVDDGIGIRPEDRRRIFEPYFSRKEHGTGLGLAIVSRIVADHRGYVRVHDAQPRGARFIVELPASAEGRARRAGERA
ncbi:MAG: PAS domain-containing sensor histidine kinase [Proteobacteria bacterium]|nr:MAG: PAS domain-containing sensor histidine kinase [Pseudomonadota bacterium]